MVVFPGAPGKRKNRVESCMARATIIVTPQQWSTAVPTGTPRCTVYASTPSQPSTPTAGHHCHVALGQSMWWPQWPSPVPDRISYHWFPEAPALE